MSLGSHIRGLITPDAPPSFSWSDWKCREYYMWDMDEGFLEDASDAAAIGLMLATSEWISNRLIRLVDNPMPAYAQVAGWAYMVEPDACLYFEPDDDAWRGPERAPLSIMAVIIMDALFCRDADPEVRTRAHWMANLARYILDGEAGGFDAWHAWAVDRVTALHPRSEMPKLSIFDIPQRFEPVVGRSLFEPGAAYDPANARAEMLAVVQGGDRDNPMIDFEVVDSLTG